MQDMRGVAVSGASAKALDAFETALAELQCYSADPVATVDSAVAESPDFVMAHCMRAYLHILATERPAMAEAQSSYDAAKDLSANDREREHLAAVRGFLAGDWRAGIEALENVLIGHPWDILASQVAHVSDFFVGDSRSLRDRVARVLPAWSDDMPGYHALLGMHAFGLEECGDYGRAEERGRAALARNTRDCWALHAVVHVMEMQGRDDDGIQWLTSREEDWAPDNFFAVHNWWHLALYHLESGDFDKVLALYDRPIRGERSEVVLDMVDASALLWRLHLRGVDLGERLSALADDWEPRADGGFYAFNDAHAAMAFAGCGRLDAIDRMVATMERRCGEPGSNAMMTADVGLPVVKAIRAFGQGDYDTAVALLRPIRSRAHRFGGSHAQRDILDLTLIEAALRAGQFGLARGLASERSQAKPHSPLARLYQERAAAGLNS